MHATPRRLVALVLAGASLAACTNAAKPVANDGSVLADSAPALTKPSVKAPASPPTELRITDLVAGSGPKAEQNSTVVVHYVGVRQADGKEFDNSYERGEPLVVTLGMGAVIRGWDQGLVGVQAGTRRQLDIPNELAYGKSDSGSVIKSGDALSFVVDVVAVATPPAEAPTISDGKQANTTAMVIKDLVIGAGAVLSPTSTAIIHLIALRADTGEVVSNTWTSGAPGSVRVSEVVPGLAAGLTGMKVGGRRWIQVPYAKAFGDAGNPDLGVPGKVDVVFVADVFAAY